MLHESTLSAGGHSQLLLISKTNTVSCSEGLRGRLVIQQVGECYAIILPAGLRSISVSFPPPWRQGSQRQRVPQHLNDVSAEAASVRSTSNSRNALHVTWTQNNFSGVHFHVPSLCDLRDHGETVSLTTVFCSRQALSTGMRRVPSPRTPSFRGDGPSPISSPSGGGGGVGVVVVVVVRTRC